MGALAFTMGDFMSARANFERGLRASPESELIFTNLARVLYAMGEWTQLQNALNQAQQRGMKSDVLAALRNAAFGKKSGTKIFCIGRNKTGTTSLEHALMSLGFSMGLQARGEMLREDWHRREYARIAQLVETADAFQDVPFSLPGTYAAMDARFPGSKFILTVRDDADQWYRSVTEFHKKIVTGGKHLPTADELKRFSYRYPGYLWDAARMVYGATEETLYDKTLYTKNYLDHNEAVRQHFSERPADLLVLNVSSPDAMRSLCAFLSIEWTGQTMPHSNKT
ncbi:MAG: sulfotransferase [Rhizobacter sp.]